MEGLESAGRELRVATADDADLIERILGLAGDWQSEEPAMSIADLPDAYCADWGRPDDVGILIFEGIEFVGGAYARRVGPADGTHGYVAPDLHELTIGIESTHRGSGVGRLALEALKAKVLERGLGGLSLSVSLDNTAARRLYAAANFTEVEQRPTDALMSWRPARL